MKKRILIAALAACVMLSFAGCSTNETTPTTDNSFGAIDLTPEEPANAARYIREFVHDRFEEFSKSSYGQFSVSESEVKSGYTDDYQTIKFEIEFTDSENSYDVSCISGYKSYNIMLFDRPQAFEIKNLLAATIYASGAGFTPEQAVEEAESMAATMPSMDARPCRTETREYGNCKVFVNYDRYFGFIIYSHHNSDNEITDVSSLDISQYTEGLPSEYGYYKFDAEVISTGVEDSDRFPNDIVTVNAGGNTYNIWYSYTSNPITFTSGETHTFYVYYFDKGYRLECVE